MKKKRIIAYAIALMTFTACSKTDLNPHQADTPEMAVARAAMDQTNETLLSGNWAITYSWNNNTEETRKFEGCKVMFVSNGTLSAFQNNFNAAGKWVSSYIDDKVRISLNITDPAYKAICGNWTIVESTNKKIIMKAVESEANMLVIEKK